MPRGRATPFGLADVAGGFNGDGKLAITRQAQAAMSAFPWSVGVHIRAIPLGVRHPLAHNPHAFSRCLKPVAGCD